MAQRRSSLAGGPQVFTTDPPRYKLGNQVWVVKKKKKQKQKKCKSSEVRARCPACAGVGYFTGADGRRWECPVCDKQGHITALTRQAQLEPVRCSIREIITRKRRGGSNYQYIAVPVGKSIKSWERRAWLFREENAFPDRETAEAHCDGDESEEDALLDTLNDEMPDLMHKSEDRDTFTPNEVHQLHQLYVRGDAAEE